MDNTVKGKVECPGCGFPAINSEFPLTVKRTGREVIRWFCTRCGWERYEYLETKDEQPK